MQAARRLLRALGDDHHAELGELHRQLDRFLRRGMGQQHPQTGLGLEPGHDLAQGGLGVGELDLGVVDQPLVALAQNGCDADRHAAGLHHAALFDNRGVEAVQTDVRAEKHARPLADGGGQRDQIAGRQRRSSVPKATAV